jgi:hypothetical protein
MEQDLSDQFSKLGIKSNEDIQNIPPQVSCLVQEIRNAARINNLRLINCEIALLETKRNILANNRDRHKINKIRLLSIMIMDHRGRRLKFLPPFSERTRMVRKS